MTTTTTTTLVPKLDHHHHNHHHLLPPTSTTTLSSAIHLPRTTSHQLDHQPSFIWADEEEEDAAAAAIPIADKHKHHRLFDSITSNINLSVSDASPPTPASKSCVELMKEIATLEVQILQMESYLLSLYRTAFQHHIPLVLKRDDDDDDHGTRTRTRIKDKMRRHLQSADAQPYCYEMDWAMSMSPTDFIHNYPIFPSRALPCSNDATKAASKLSSGRADDDQVQQADSGHRSLADHLGASHIDYALDSPNKLSEEIVRCICCIYCKFATPALPHKGFSVSSTSSLSSSSTFSPRNISGSWSPQFNEEPKGFFEGLRDDAAPYSATIQVLKICLDDDSFKYAATMLQKFRSLVKSLENVDPRKMKREEKLAFWLNIHNALVMHGYLAYGTHSFARSSSILKAAYNVGGHCINAHAIQSSILGIRSHYSAPWLQTLLSPKKRFVIGTAKHSHSLEYPEPLVHFALCSGSCSDPSVRIYTANNVFQDLKVARDEFLRATVYIHKETKVYLPKVVCYFGREMSLSTSELLETVCACLPELQQKGIRACIKGGREEKCISWIPQSSTFRFLIHKDVQGREGRVHMLS